MKRINLIWALAVVLLVFAGCKKEEFANSPVYGKIYCKTPNPKVGEPVILTVEIKEPGNRINSADYHWKCSSLGFDKRVKVIRQSGSNSIPDAPELEYTFDTSGSYTFRLEASFKYTMGDVNTSMIGAASASGIIKINP